MLLCSSTTILTLGNVAHDLKTPLFAIEADIEILKLLLNAIPAAVINVAKMTLCQLRNCEESDVDPSNIFESLFSTCRSTPTYNFNPVLLPFLT